VLAPVGAVGDHRAGPGDDGADEACARRQRRAGFDVHHHRLVGAQAGGDADPVRKAAVAAHRGDRLAGFEDQKGVGHGGGE